MSPKYSAKLGIIENSVKKLDENLVKKLNKLFLI